MTYRMLGFVALVWSLWRPLELFFFLLLSLFLSLSPQVCIFWASYSSVHVYVLPISSSAPLQTRAWERKKTWKSRPVFFFFFKLESFFFFKAGAHKVWFVHLCPTRNSNCSSHQNLLCSCQAASSSADAFEKSNSVVRVLSLVDETSELAHSLSALFFLFFFFQDPGQKSFVTQVYPKTQCINLWARELCSLALFFSPCYKRCCCILLYFVVAVVLVSFCFAAT